MNYIGSKRSIIDFIDNTIIDVVGSDKEYVLCDLFAGTGVVGKHFKKKGFSIISNDSQFYSFVINKHFIYNNEELLFKNLNGIDNVFSILNGLSDYKGFIYNNYTDEGTKNSEYKRMYFTSLNAIKIDSIRNKIECWYRDNFILENEYYYLIACLLEAADKVANTASVYESFLKKIKKTALNTLELRKLSILISCNNDNEVFNEDCNNLIKHISGDILYLDPPYNVRKYNTNYHILETIARNDNPKIKGKSGLRVYKFKSKFNSKVHALDALEDIIVNAKFKFIFLSYNDEGIINIDDIKNMMMKYGVYKRYEKKHKRYKANKGKSRRTTIEYLHVLIKNDFS